MVGWLVVGWLVFSKFPVLPFLSRLIFVPRTQFRTGNLEINILFPKIIISSNFSKIAVSSS